MCGGKETQQGYDSVFQSPKLIFVVWRSVIMPGEFLEGPTLRLITRLIFYLVGVSIPGHSGVFFSN